MWFILTMAALVFSGATWFTAEVLANNYFSGLAWAVVAAVWLMALILVVALAALYGGARGFSQLFDKLLGNWR